MILGRAGARATEVRTNQLGCALDFDRSAVYDVLTIHVPIAIEVEVA